MVPYQTTIPAFAMPLRRGEFFAWIACVLFADDLARVQVANASQIVPALLENITTRSVIYFLGCYAVIRLLLDADPKRPVRRLDILLGLTASLVGLLQYRAFMWIAATALSFYLLATSGGDRKFKAAAVVLLAIVTNAFWGRIVFELFEPVLLRTDAALVGTALSLFHPDLAWQGNIVGAPSGFSIRILSGCSSFHNISMALLCWVALTKLAGRDWNRQDLPLVIGVIAVVIACNAARLYAMALSFEGYLYWHSGFGSQIYAAVTTLFVLAISVWSAARTPKVAM